ncbi:MAG: NAD-dependent epimerase/dehydratase family protein [Candidatus Aminicenantes bacterium]|nr:NAD-dependent epimerase/dehydratase family protein [Candidatus Aminicenantes bacterium]
MSLKVFISGATGFVGHHLIDLLSSSECEISGTFFPDEPGIEDGCGGKDISCVDIRSEEKVFETIKKTQPNWIFHLAAVSNVRHSWEKRTDTLETNIMGTFYLFEAARKFAPKVRILFISSSDVYGILVPTEKALKEEDSFHVVNPYAFTKVSGEILSKFYAEVENLDIIIARSFSHTGPGQSPDFVCSDWALQIARIEKGLAKPVIEVGNLNGKRDFTDVRDIVKAYVLLLEKGRRGEVYNVCSGKAAALREILDLLLSFSSQKIEVQVDSSKLRKADIPLLLGDNQKLKKETSWEPEISLKQSLSDLLEYWRKRV